MHRRHHRSNLARKLLVALVVGAAVYLGARLFVNDRPAPMPQMFDQHLVLDQAILRANLQQKLVLLVAGSDSGCPACDSYKGQALSDFDVQGWVASYALPVYLDVEIESDAAEQLGIENLPVTILFRDGREISRREGALSPEKLQSWLEEARLRTTPEERSLTLPSRSE